MFESIVIDNLLDEKKSGALHNTIMNLADWRFLNDVSGVSNQTYPSHGFVNVMNHPSSEQKSNMFNHAVSLIVPALIEKNFKFKEIYYSRIFLQLPLAAQYLKEHNGVHVDLPPEFPHIAGVYYVNDSDGETIIYNQTIDEVPGNSQNVNLKEHMRVKPKAGRMVLFDGARYHCSSQPTLNYRCIINFDFLKGE
jgi:hypothetical protein